ncbi:MAG: SDR family oxidoreductase [Anaerolineales bacterium]
MRDIKNKTVLLTGAARGLGKELARLLALERCALILVDREDADAPAPARFLRCDLSDPTQRSALIESLRHEKIDILINCAGVGSHSARAQLSVEETRRVMQINALAPLELMAGLTPLSLIVNIGSVAGEMPLPSMSLYAASKAALHTFTRALASEGADAMLVMLGPLRGTDFVKSIEHPRKGQPRWYRALDVDAPAAAQKILRAIRRGSRELIFPAWYGAVIQIERGARGILRRVFLSNSGYL